MSRYYKLTTIAALALAAAACAPQWPKDPGVIAREIYRLNRERILNAVRENFRAHGYAGLPRGAIDEIYVFDLDHTLVDTRTMIPYRSAGAFEMDALSDSKCMVIGPDEPADYSVFTREELLESPPVAAGLAELKQAAATGAPIFILTSRGGSGSFKDIPAYLEREGLRVNGVFPVNSRFFGRRIWWEMPKPEGVSVPPEGMKKPYLIAALIDLARQQGAWPKRVVYHDDTDKHFRGAMLLLALMFPEIQFELVDYIRTARGKDFEYTRRPAARSRGQQWFTPDGVPIKDGSKYDSGDCPGQFPYAPVIFY